MSARGPFARCAARSSARSRPGIALDERGYTRFFIENLVSCVEVSDFEADLAQGSGDELAHKFRAPHSSSALAVNCFAPFRRNLQDLRLCGAEGFSSMRFEARCPTGLGGVPPYLDVLLECGERVIAIESKCLEPLSTHVAHFVPSYRTGICDARRDTAWYRELLSLMKCPRAYRCLDAAQLIKHALGLMHTYHDRPLTLLYLYWEPRGVTDYVHFEEHHHEVAGFAERVTGPPLAFKSMTYTDLWASWDAGAPRWLRAHLRELRNRYSIEV